jgi:diguanylate cyclase (GGDEF)-like protein
MTATVFHQPDGEYTRSVISVRWLLVILAAYLTFFSYVETTMFPWVVAFVVLFASSNIVCMVLSKRHAHTVMFQQTLFWMDLFFGCATFYLLRVPGTYLFLPFVLIYAMASIRRDLKVVALAVIAVSLFYGLFSLLRLDAEYGAASMAGMVKPVPTQLEQFLTLALFFVVAVFYLFLSDRLRHDAHLSSLLQAEHRRAEIMGEITRSFTSSLNSQEILYLIVTRLSEVFDAADCSIVRLEADNSTGRLLVKSAQPDVRDSEIDLEAYPEIRHANIARDLLFVPEVRREGVLRSVIVMPMLAQESVLGIIHVQLNANRKALSETDARFFRMMSATAANALHNAQLFEEMEHRARTDFLTGLPNHRFFQTTLSTELTRANRHNHPLSLLIVDLDHLKDVNDRFGHPTGDTVIREVAETIRMTCRDSDFAARYGGEEFTVILAETPLDGAIQTAERVRERISRIEFPGVGRITASIGVANYPVNALGKEDLIRVADRALYVAKNNGRNRVGSFDYQLVSRLES